MMALGADWCNSARGFMFALGCLQAQTCHTGNCPTGVTTQDPLREKSLVVDDKTERVYNYHAMTMHALKELVQAAGLMHPRDVTAHHIVRRSSDGKVRSLAQSVLTQVKRWRAAADRTRWPAPDLPPILAPRAGRELHAAGLKERATVTPRAASARRRRSTA